MIDFQGIKLIVWDLDGTLIDSLGVYKSILTEACQLSGLAVPDDETIRHNFHGSLDQTIKDTFAMVDGDNFDKLLNDFLRVQEDYYREPEEHVYEDALRMMERLQGNNVMHVIATNRAHVGRGTASPRYLVEHSSMRDYIDDIVCGDEAPKRKPDAAVLANVTAAQNLAAAEIVVIGDQFVDAQLAQNLGAQAIVVNRGDDPVPHLEKLGEDTSFLTVVSSLDEVSV